MNKERALSSPYYIYGGDFCSMNLLRLAIKVGLCATLFVLPVGRDRICMFERTNVKGWYRQPFCSVIVS